MWKCSKDSFPHDTIFNKIITKLFYNPFFPPKTIAIERKTIGATWVLGRNLFLGTAVALEN